MLMSYALVGRTLKEQHTSSPTDQLVLVALAWHAPNEDGRDIYPSVATVSRMTSLSRRTVQAALRRLEKQRLIARDGLVGEGPGRTVIRYRMTLPHPRAGDAPGAGDAPPGRISRPEGAQELRPSSKGSVNRAGTRAGARDLSHLDAGVRG